MNVNTARGDRARIGQQHVIKFSRHRHGYHPPKAATAQGSVFIGVFRIAFCQRMRGCERRFLRLFSKVFELTLPTGGPLASLFQFR